MIEASADVFEAHKSLWRDDGLVYRMENVRNYENQLNSGTQFNLSHQTNIKSLKSALSVLTDQTAANSGVNAIAVQEAYSQSTFNKKDMNSFRFRVGGLSYPEYGSVNVDNVGCAEAWRMLKQALGDDSVRMQSSIDPWRFRTTTGDRFIMGMRFSKDYSYNTGLDCSSNYLEQEMVLNTTIVSGTDDQTVHTFLTYDQALILSEKQGMRVYY